MSKIVTIDCETISDWESFHRVFAEAFRFPSFYGRNNAALVDCLTHPGEMTNVGLTAQDIITIRLRGEQSLKRRAPKLLEEIFEIAGFVNYRRLEADEPGRVCVSAFVE
jgi:RNAse (barnase) inhibitor barstar